MEKSSFFNAHLKNGVYDRTYQAEDFAKYFSTFIGNGVFPKPSTNCQVIANDNMTIKLQPGLAWINGYLYQNTDELQLTVDPADGVLNRQDRVVLRLDFINREIKAYVLKGEYTSSDTPHAPELTRTADIYELGLAQIDVMAGVTKITQSAINDVRWQVHQCGIVSGTVQTVDITTLYNQYKTKFEEDENNFATKANSTYADFNKKLNDSYLEFTNNFNTWFDDNTTEWSDEFTSWFDGIKKKLSDDIATSLQNQIDILNESVKNHNHDNVYVKQDGSTPIIGRVQMPRGSYAHEAVGEGISGNWMLVAEINIKSDNINQPLEFNIAGRNRQTSVTLWILFEATNGTDPALISFKYNNTKGYQAYLVKKATSTWSLYINKSEPYDFLDIIDVHIPKYTDIVVTYKSTTVSTLPEGGTYASPLQHAISEITNLQSALDSKAPEKYILQFEGSISSDFRKKIIGTTDVCGFVKSFRKNDSSDACMPPFGAGLAWGQVATHAMLYADINNTVAYISAGNNNKLNWYKQLAWKDDLTKLQTTLDGRATKFVKFASEVNKWGKIAEFNIKAANGCTAATFMVQTIGDNDNNSRYAIFSVNMKQTDAMGKKPKFLITTLLAKNFDAVDNIKGVLVENSSSLTKVELYIRQQTLWDGYIITCINGKNFWNGSFTMFEDLDLLDNVPTGISSTYYKPAYLQNFYTNKDATLAYCEAEADSTSVTQLNDCDVSTVDFAFTASTDGLYRFDVSLQVNTKMVVVIIDGNSRNSLFVLNNAYSGSITLRLKEGQVVKTVCPINENAYSSIATIDGARLTITACAAK